MTLSEIRAELTRLAPEDLVHVANFLATLQNAHSPEFGRELARRHRDMDAGRKISSSELARILAAKPPATAA